MTLRLSADLREAVIDHAREGAPEEVVGVLAGKRGTSEVNAPDSRVARDAPRPSDHASGPEAREQTGSEVTREPGEETSVVERRYPAENAAATPETRYEIAPREELELLERVDDAGLDVVGFYHSHPRGPATPSATDARLAAWPGYSYVVVSLAGEAPAVGSWRWTGETFRREAVEIR